MWLCLRFPRLFLDRELLSDSMPANTPQALLEAHKIRDVNRLAHDYGVRSGQSLSQARALCPALQARSPCPQRMQARLEQLALWAYRFTSDISLATPDCLLLNLSASLKLFGGFQPLFQRLQRGFKKRRIPVAYGLAHTPLGAELLSRIAIAPAHVLNERGDLCIESTRGYLDRQASCDLPCDKRYKELLLTLGLDTIGHVRQLPRSALKRRFDSDFVSMLERLYGTAPDPRQTFQVPDTFHAERQFNGELTRSEELRFPIAGLLDELGHFLRLKQWMSRQLAWHFHYSSGKHEQLSLPLSQTHFDRRQLLGLMLLKLEHFRLQGPVDSLSLHCTRFESIEQYSSELFQSAKLFDRERHTRYLTLLDKLQTRLGSNKLWQQTVREEHLPEQASQQVAATQTPGTHSSRLTQPDNTQLLRPLWLLDAAQRLQENNAQPHWQGPLQLLQGPERIDSAWWQQRQVRDYYIAKAENGALCWVYRDCLQQGWYLHGFFS